MSSHIPNFPTRLFNLSRSSFIIGTPTSTYYPHPDRRHWISCTTASGNPIHDIWVTKTTIDFPIDVGTYVHLFDRRWGIDCDAKVIAVDWKRLEKHYIVFQADGASWSQHNSGLKRPHTINFAVPRPYTHLSLRHRIKLAFRSLLCLPNTISTFMDDPLRPPSSIPTSHASSSDNDSEPDSHYVLDIMAHTDQEEIRISVGVQVEEMMD